MGLGDLREVERATVLKAGIPAATLERHSQSVVFSYLQTYLAEHLPPVATSLPRSTEAMVTHAAGALPPFFSGLLPEGRRLSALRRAVKTSADDEFSLLLAVGRDTVGDVRIQPEGDNDLGEATPAIEVTEWSQVHFPELFAVSVGEPERIDRVALPGVQEKVSLSMINLPVARAGSRYFLKLDPPEFPHLVANEAFFVEAARRSGIETAQVEVVRDAHGNAGLLIHRFDRITTPAGEPLPLAQEDACQVLGRFPADKYRLTTEEVIRALSSLCRARPVAAVTLLKQVAFAYLACNGDAHAKNFSIRRFPPGEWRVCPAYDLPSSYPYGDTTMALSVNGRNRENIRRADFLALGIAVNLRKRAVERVLDDLCDAVPLWIGELDQLPFDRGRIRKLRRAIEYRRDRLAS